MIMKEEPKVVWLCKQHSEGMNSEDRVNWLLNLDLSATQIEIIEGHIGLLEKDMLIGYADEDVYVWADIESDEIIKITKN